MLLRLALDSWAQMVLLPLPPESPELQACTISSSLNVLNFNGCLQTSTKQSSKQSSKTVEAVFPPTMTDGW